MGSKHSKGNEREWMESKNILDVETTMFGKTSNWSQGVEWKRAQLSSTTGGVAVMVLMVEVRRLPELLTLRWQ